MSSWKRAAKAGQKTHRERHQPEVRNHLGLLEKKKDYISRARDSQEKRATIKLLRKRALNRNPDEFHFHMINSKMENGIHREKEKHNEHTPEQIKLMETQDIKYVAYKRNIEAKKIDKLQSQMHMLDATDRIQNQHVFFLDNGKQVENFDLVKKLDTHPALMSKRTNRLKMSILKDMRLPEWDEKTIAKIEQSKCMSYEELQKRVKRERQLMIVQQKLETRIALKDKKTKKPKLVKPGTRNNAPVYKWKFERKR